MKKLSIAALVLFSLAVLPVFSQSAAGRYEEYSKAAFDGAAGKIRVLFFHAAWCPFCRTADANFRKNVNAIPENVTVFKTDYDTEKALKNKYGITYQHTFVQVDAEGNAVSKWSGGDIDNLVRNLKTSRID